MVSIMNISLYLDEKLLHRLDAAIEKKHISRSKAMREAAEQWLGFEEPSGWGKGFFDFEGDPSFPTVEELRKDTKEQYRDPFKL